MNLEEQQSTHQIQRESLSPLMMKSIQLLSMPYFSLRTFLQQRFLENPFLEFHEQDSYALIGASAFSDSGTGGMRDYDPTAMLVADPTIDTLHAYLRMQMGEVHISDSVRRVGYRVIEWLDGRGWCREAPHVIAETENISVSLVCQALEVIRTFSPKGVGASGLRDCLLLQADPMYCSPAILDALLRAPLELLESRNYARLAAFCGCTVAQARKGLGYLSTLNPNPGGAFVSTDRIPYIYPEISVFVSQNHLQFSFLSGCELISVNHEFAVSAAEQAAGDGEAEDYIRTTLHQADELMQELQLRKRTMESLLSYLIRVQEDYFLSPTGQLRPLTMRTAAEHLGMHPSTISRCVNGRYIQTHDGVIPLKSLFTSALPGPDGEISSAAIKSKICGMIREEDTASPLSDQKITQFLEDDGIRISRRTVAKYRENLGIRDSRERRKVTCIAYQTTEGGD